eukprot:4716177-Prymnesium_polylepis.1
MAPPDEEQLPGPLALAVQYQDLDFCSAPCVRAFVEDFFIGPMTLEKEPASWERIPLKVGTYELPRVLDVYETYRSLCNDGDLEWPKPMLAVLYNTCIAAYRPNLAFSVPAVRFLFDLIVHLAVVVSMYAANPLNVNAFSVYEGIVYAFAVGSTMQEGHELLEYGLARYRDDPINVLDLIIIVLLGVCMTLRLMQLSTGADAYVVVGMKGEPMSVAQMPYSWATIASGLRLLPFLQHSQGLGSLVYVIFKMFALMARFLVVIAIVMFGFIVGMFGLIHAYGDPVEGYYDIGNTLLTLFAAANGDFSMEFAIADPIVSTNARLMMGVFIATITLLCLNLLIAFLTDAYTQVSEDKEKAFAWTRAAAVIETDTVIHNLANKFVTPANRPGCIYAPDAAAGNAAARRGAAPCISPSRPPYTALRPQWLLLRSRGPLDAGCLACIPRGWQPGCDAGSSLAAQLIE